RWLLMMHDRSDDDALPITQSLLAEMLGVQRPSITNAARENMHQPVVSSIPTLLISGTFDTLTSLAGAKAAAAKLSNATIISIPGVGHAVSPQSPCAQAVVVSFLANPAAPDTSCVGALKPSNFNSMGSP